MASEGQSIPNIKSAPRRVDGAKPREELTLAHPAQAAAADDASTDASYDYRAMAAGKIPPEPNVPDGASLDTFRAGTKKAAAAAAAEGLDAAAARRFDPAFAERVGEGGGTKEPGRDHAEEADKALRDGWTNREGGLVPGADRRQSDSETEEEESPFEGSILDPRRARQQAVITDELTATPDYGVPHESGPKTRPGSGSGGTSGGEASIGSTTPTGDARLGETRSGGGSGTPLFGPVAELAGQGTDIGAYADESVLLSERLGKMGAGLEADPSITHMADRMKAGAEAGGPSVAAGETKVTQIDTVPDGAPVADDKAKADQKPAKSQEEPSIIVDALERAAEVVEEVAPYLAATAVVIGIGAAVVAAPAVAGLAAAAAAAVVVTSPTPDAGTGGAPGGGVSDPGSDPESVGGGRPTPADWEYRNWLMQATGRNPFGPGSGDVDPADNGAPEGGGPTALSALGKLGLIGQPVQGEHGRMNPRGELRVEQLAGDKGNVDPGEDADTGPWSSDQRTEDESDALDGFGGSGLGIGDLRRGNSNDDEDEESEKE